MTMLDPGRQRTARPTADSLDAHRPALTTKNLRVRAVFLWDGFAAGTWTIRKAKGVATITLEPFARLPKGATAALRDEAEHLATFIEPDAKGHATAVSRG